MTLALSLAGGCIAWWVDRHVVLLQVVNGPSQLNQFGSIVPFLAAADHLETYVVCFKCGSHTD